MQLPKAATRLSFALLLFNLAACQSQEASGSFSTNSVTTGYTLPLNLSTVTSKTVILSVIPKAKAQSVQLVITGNARVSIQNIVRNPADGTITFDVKGLSATPSNLANGDTQIEAQDGAQVLASTNVVVVIPAAIATPHPVYDGTVSGLNLATDASTTPAWFGPLTADQVKLISWHVISLDVAVNDQFGNRLDAIYAGAAVTENAAQPINQNMTATGTYSDPVGSFRFGPGSLVSRTIAHPTNPASQIPNPAVTRFLNGPVLPIYVIDELQNISVQVGGHALNPGVVNRRVQTSSPDKLKITWP